MQSVLGLSTLAVLLQQWDPSGMCLLVVGAVAAPRWCAVGVTLPRGMLRYSQVEVQLYICLDIELYGTATCSACTMRHAKACLRHPSITAIAPKHEALKDDQGCVLTHVTTASTVQ